MAAKKQSNQILEVPDGKLGPDLPDASFMFPKGGEWSPLVEHWYEEFRKVRTRPCFARHPRGWRCSWVSPPSTR